MIALALKDASSHDSDTAGSELSLRVAQLNAGKTCRSSCLDASRAGSAVTWCGYGKGDSSAVGLSGCSAWAHPAPVGMQGMPAVHILHPKLFLDVPHYRG